MPNSGSATQSSEFPTVDGVRVAVLRASLYLAGPRLTKVRTTIARLGKTMSIQIAEPYHRARVQEIKLTADHLGKHLQHRCVRSGHDQGK
jgi:hypothetical protein